MSTFIVLKGTLRTLTIRRRVNSHKSNTLNKNEQNKLLQVHLGYPTPVLSSSDGAESHTVCGWTIAYV